MSLELKGTNMSFLEEIRQKSADFHRQKFLEEEKRKQEEQAIQAKFAADAILAFPSIMEEIKGDIIREASEGKTTTDITYDSESHAYSIIDKIVHELRSMNLFAIREFKTYSGKQLDEHDVSSYVVLHIWWE